ncbi:MAG: hypothetical protein HUU20_23945 [Pirellulales bacterium]|nr:hypothetical protein [Pirellulales bacterium]
MSQTLPNRILARAAVAASFLALLGPPGTARGQINGEVFSGEPFGVGRIQIELPEPLQPEVLGLGGIQITEKNGRVYYPVIDHRSVAPLAKELVNQLPLQGGPVRELAGGILRGMVSTPPRKAELFFLFRGVEPLEITLQFRGPVSGRLVPGVHGRAHQRLLREWWDEYTDTPGLLARKPDYPPLVENYLRSMLARRLGLRLSDRSAPVGLQSQIEKQFGLATSTESVRITLERDRMLGVAPLGQAADQPLPAPLDVPPMEIPEMADDVAVEPLAARVPAECLYVRFGTFSNFLWFQDMLAQWGGDLQNLVALRGLDYQTRKRFEDQLVLKTTALSKLFGDAVVTDVAIVGTDLLFQDGGAYGLLFQARNTAMLGNDFARQRRERIGKDDGVVEEKVTIAGREVSLLATPDGSVHSYYAVDGDYHFATTSKTLVRRFLETASGQNALGASREFRYARSEMPLDRKDTVFVYLSDAFFRNLVGPHYRIETLRRVQALADLELVQLAVLTSATEGKPGNAVEQLVAGALLPPEFGARPDGSRTVLDDGEVYDSLRGHRGYFTPIPDVELSAVTAAEADAYREFADFYRANWQRLDPVVVGLKRHGMAGRRERIEIDVRMTPMNKANYDRIAKNVGPADKVELAPIPINMVSFEFIRPEGRLFGGLQDFGMPFDSLTGSLLPEGGLRNVLVGYLGTTGGPGLLGFLERRMGPPDPNGMASTPAGIWRRQLGQFTAYSFQPDMLMAVMPQLRFEEAERPAQLRAHVADLTELGVPPLLNRFGYLRTRATTLGNLRLLHQLSQQLHVPGPDCKTAAELLLGAKLICPLGGEYVYREAPEGAAYWTSTALEGSRTPDQPPPGFVTPPLSWFRGMALDAELTPAGLSAHVELQMQLPEKPR